MRESWLNFFWTGEIPEMDDLFARQKYLKESQSEFNTKLWVDDQLFQQLAAGKKSDLFNSIEHKNPNELEVERDGQKLIISNFDKVLLEPARDRYPKCCQAYDLLKENRLYAWASDFARILILKHAAGFYSDFDIELDSKTRFPKSLADLAEGMGTALEHLDDFISRKDTQVILTFNKTACEKVLDGYESKIDVTLVKVKEDITDRKKKEAVAQEKVSRTYGDISTPEYQKFLKVVEIAKKVFCTENQTPSFHGGGWPAEDPYVIERLDESAQFVYNHPVGNYRGNIPYVDRNIIRKEINKIFSNPLQDRVHNIYNWQNPQLMQVLNQWCDAHKLIASVLTEIKSMFKTPDPELQALITVFEKFSIQFSDTALHEIKDKIFEDPIRDILFKHGLLTSENKIEMKILTGLPSGLYEAPLNEVPLKKTSKPNSATFFKPSEKYAAIKPKIVLDCKSSKELAETITVGEVRKILSAWEKIPFQYREIHQGLSKNYELLGEHVAQEEKEAISSCLKRLEGVVELFEMMKIHQNSVPGYQGLMQEIEKKEPSENIATNNLALILNFFELLKPNMDKEIGEFEIGIQKIQARINAESTESGASQEPSSTS